MWGKPIVEQDPNGLKPGEPGAKLDLGKNRLDLVLGGFSKAILEVGKVGTYGANKYVRDGWLAVPDGIDRYSDALLRHYFSSKLEAIDKDSELLHLSHMAWNALAVLELTVRKMEDLNKNA